MNSGRPRRRPAPRAGLRGLLARFLGDRRGGFAVLTAVALPAVIVVGVGAVQLQAVNNFRQVTQGVADSAAIWGSQQLAITPSGAPQRAQAWANSQLNNIPDGAKFSVTASQVDAQTLKVAIDSNMPSFFVNLFPPGGFNLHVESAAQALRQTPLCVLIFGDDKGNNLHLQDASTMQASSCLVHSNKDLQVDKSAQLGAQAVEAGGKASGANITPAASTGAPTIDDPFSGLDLSFPKGCSAVAGSGSGPGGGPGPGAAITDSYTGTDTIPAGLHCNNVLVYNGATVTLAPGIHYFNGNLIIQDTSSLGGDGVLLEFATNASFDFSGSSSVSLNGLRSGALAGFVITGARDNEANFIIESDHVTNLLGTIYIPSGQLQVTGTAKVAQASAWTVITARSMLVHKAPPAPGAAPGTSAGSPQLIVNANYASSTVPRPVGVGDNGSQASARLIR